MEILVLRMQEVLSAPELIDMYISCHGHGLESVKPFVSQQLQLAGWPALPPVLAQQCASSHSPPAQLNPELASNQQMRQLLREFRLPRQRSNGTAETASATPSVEAALVQLALSGGDIAAKKAAQEEQLLRAADDFEAELSAAAWPPVTEILLLCIGAQAVLDGGNLHHMFLERVMLSQGIQLPADAVLTQHQQSRGQRFFGAVNKIMPRAARSPRNVHAALLAYEIESDSLPLPQNASPIHTNSGDVNRDFPTASCMNAHCRPGMQSGTTAAGHQATDEEVKRTEEAAAALIQDEQSAKATLSAKASKAMKHRQRQQQHLQACASKVVPDPPATSNLAGEAPASCSFNSISWASEIAAIQRA